MSLTGFNFPDRRTWSSAASPSNLAMAALVGFLFVGQATDWKILRRKAKPQSSVKFGAPEVAGKSAGADVRQLRQLRTGAPRNMTSSNGTPSKGTQGDSSSEEVADRRPMTRESETSRRELD